MTALALAFQDLGKKISGSDTIETFPTDKILKQRQIKVKIGFKATHLPKSCDLLVYTGAHGASTNLEVIEAQKKGIRVLAHSQALGLLAADYKVLAVAGVGGKSTTSAMLATILHFANIKAGWCVGVGNIPCLKTSGKVNKNNRFLVAEADEYVTDPIANLTPRFHYLKPYLSLITNLEYDHPDVYKNIEAIFKSFQTFIQPAEMTIINFDNPRNRQFIKTINQPIITYGFSPQADWQIMNIHVADKKQLITIKYKNIIWPEIILNVPGDYNALNALAAIAAASYLGISPQKIKQSLKLFTGTLRRFELIKEVKGISLYDDYAHHPTEIEAVLKAATHWLPNRRIIIIFQSHTYSRTKALLTEFARSFTSAEVVIINDIFSSAREKNNLGLIGEIFTSEVKKYHSQVYYCPGVIETINCLKKIIKKGDVILTVGAGNNWLWHKEIIKILKLR